MNYVNDETVKKKKKFTIVSYRKSKTINVTVDLLNIFNFP